MGCGASTPGEASTAAAGGKEARAAKWGDTSKQSSRVTVYGRSELPQELAEFALRPKCEEIFLLADKDHDGRLDLEELRDIMHRPEMAVRCTHCGPGMPCTHG